MDQEKIGRFIQKLRKEKNITQNELADKLLVTENAIGNWENGRRMPDYSILKELCEILDTNVNELLSGEKIQNYKEKAEENLIKSREQEEAYNKRLLALDNIIKIITSISYLALLYANIISENNVNKYLFMILSIVIILIGLTAVIKIETDAGYYECGNCKHRYIPSFKAVYLSWNKGKTRYLICPKCHKKSWNNKVLYK